MAKLAYEGKNCDRAIEVLRVNDIADALRLQGEKQRGDEGKEQKLFHEWGVVAS